MNMKITEPRSDQSEAGFSLLELVLVVAILTIVMGAVFNGMDQATKRSQVEQTKVDLTQQGREFIDEFERDVHQAGYPNCRMVATATEYVDPTLGPLGCPPDNTYPIVSNPNVVKNPLVAAGVVSISNTQVVIEGDVDGSGTVSQVWYQLVDSAGTPVAQSTGTCPCKLQRAQIAKTPTSDATWPLPQPAATAFSLELQNVVNSGQSTTAGVYSGGLSIAGDTVFGETNTAYYAAVSAFKDFPVFQAYDQLGNIVQISTPLDLHNSSNLNCSPTSQTCIKSIRLTINLLANATTGVDLKTNTRPVTTLVGDARLVNN
jgi:prepilin-type N-terminal cleavage/methylation domain-containing protein